MPRGIPNKPKESEPESTDEQMYNLYVHGVTISDIALRFKVEAQDVLDVINKTEESKG